MLEAWRAGDRGQRGSRPDPGCSAAQSRSGFNLTSWSSYREFTDHSQCQAHLATTSTSAASQVDGSWEAISALTTLKAERGRRLAGGGWVPQKWKESMNHVLNIKVIKDFALTILFSTRNSLFFPPRWVGCRRRFWTDVKVNGNSHASLT